MKYYYILIFYLLVTISWGWDDDDLDDDDYDDDIDFSQHFSGTIGGLVTEHVYARPPVVNDFSMNTVCAPLYKNGFDELTKTKTSPGLTGHNGGWEWTEMLHPQKLNPHLLAAGDMAKVLKRQSKTPKNLDAHEFIPHVGSTVGVGTRRCDIDVVKASDMTAKAFRDRYVREHRPVMIRGAMSNEWIEHFQKNTLLASMGDLKVTYGVKPVDSVRTIALRDFVNATIESRPSNERPFYVWDDTRTMLSRAKNMHETNVVENVMSTLPLFAQPTFESGKSHFSVGASCSGTHVHHHTSALNMLAYGEKRWAMFESSAYHPTFNVSHHPIDWFMHVLPGLKRVKQCWQRSGDVIYVPSFWWHAVINVHTSVSVNRELHPSEREMAVESYMFMDSNNDGIVTEEEFLEYVVRRRRKLQEKPGDEGIEMHTVVAKNGNVEVDRAALRAWVMLSQGGGKFSVNTCVEQWDDVSVAMDSILSRNSN